MEQYQVLPNHDPQRGGAELLVLALLRDRPMYGYEIIRELRDRSEGYFAMEEGLLYPTLHRLEREGLVQAEWQLVGGRRRRYYAITESGLAALSSAATEWVAFSRRFLGILNPSGGGAHGGTWPIVP